MKAPLKILAAALCGLLLGLPVVQADDYWGFLQADDYSVHPNDLGRRAAEAQFIEYVYINVGAAGKENRLTMWPREVTLEAGELYRFDISNPSKDIHVVAAHELAAMVNTTELRTGGLLRLDQSLPTLDMTTGITLQPNQTIEWTFTPLSEGVYKFGCDDPVHAAAGMHTMITVVPEAL